VPTKNHMDIELTNGGDLPAYIIAISYTFGGVLMSSGALDTWCPPGSKVFQCPTVGGGYPIRAESPGEYTLTVTVWTREASGQESSIEQSFTIQVP